MESEWKRGRWGKGKWSYETNDTPTQLALSIVQELNAVQRTLNEPLISILWKAVNLLPACKKWSPWNEL